LRTTEEAGKNLAVGQKNRRVIAKLALGKFGIDDQESASGSYISPDGVKFCVPEGPEYSPPTTNTLPLGRTLLPMYRRSRLIDESVVNVPLT